MRVIKFVANALLIFVVLPVSLVAVLGFALSPLQAAAHVSDPDVVLEAVDLPAPEADEA